MAPGGAELGPGGMPDGRADDGAGSPWCGAGEHPGTTDKPAAMTTAPHRRVRGGQQRTVSIYATLAAVMERFGFCECCRP